MCIIERKVVANTRAKARESGCCLSSLSWECSPELLFLRLHMYDFKTINFRVIDKFQFFKFRFCG